MLATLGEHFLEGGWGMYPILWCLVLTAAVAVERACVLAGARTDVGPLLDAVERCLAAGDVGLAARLCDREGSPLARVVRAAALRAGAPRERIEAALLEATLRETSALHGRTHHLTALAQLALLLGLLGTLCGLVQGFGDVGLPHEDFVLDPAYRVVVLGSAISEAMNCTAFGLLTALAGLGAYTALAGRTRTVLAALDVAAARALAVAAAATPPASREAA